MTSVLEAKNLTVRYGKLEAVNNVSFSVQQSEIMTIIGPNGAGKTTLLKALMAMVPYQGSVSLMGERIDRLAVQQRVREGLLLVAETRELFAEMSVEDNLTLGAYARRDGKEAVRRDFDTVYSTFPRLAERRSQLAGTLSGGERQMLALGRALMGGPKLLMLDEPSLGLAPIVVREIFRVIAGLREMKASILLVEQNARAALQIANHAHVLETGEIAHSGPADAMLNDPRVISSYLGGPRDEPAESRARA